MRSNRRQEALHPRDTDILCGKSKTCVNHVGSRRYREYLETYRERYAQAPTKFAKIMLIKEIYHNLTPTCRFLKFNKRRNVWEEINSIDARDKIGHALRFANAKSNEQAAASASSPVSPQHPPSVPSVPFPPGDTPSGTIEELQYSTLTTQAADPRMVGAARSPALLKSDAAYEQSGDGKPLETSPPELSSADYRLSRHEEKAHLASIWGGPTLPRHGHEENVHIASSWGDPSSFAFAKSHHQDQTSLKPQAHSSSQESYGSAMSAASSLHRMEGGGERRDSIPDIDLKSIKHSGLYLASKSEEEAGALHFASFPMGHVAGHGENLQLPSPESSINQQAVQVKRKADASTQHDDTRPAVRRGSATWHEMLDLFSSPLQSSAGAASSPGPAPAPWERRSSLSNLEQLLEEPLFEWERRMAENQGNESGSPQMTHMLPGELGTLFPSSQMLPGTHPSSTDPHFRRSTSAGALPQSTHTSLPGYLKKPPPAPDENN